MVTSASRDFEAVKAMGLCTAPYKMLLFRSIELARPKKEEKHLAHFASSWFGRVYRLYDYIPSEIWESGTIGISPARGAVYKPVPIVPDSGTVCMPWNYWRPVYLSATLLYTPPCMHRLRYVNI